MELEIPIDFSEDKRAYLENLIVIKNTIYSDIVGQLMAGECKSLSDSGSGYGYPYDYELYSKDSMDPVVQMLNSLLEKVEETFEGIKAHYTY